MEEQNFEEDVLGLLSLGNLCKGVICTHKLERVWKDIQLIAAWLITTPTE